jgi:hypothetical protein
MSLGGATSSTVFHQFAYDWITFGIGGALDAVRAPAGLGMALAVRPPPQVLLRAEDQVGQRSRAMADSRWM